MNERSLSLTLLTVTMGIYAFGLSLLIDTRPISESREQFFYVLSILVLFPIAFFLARFYYNRTKESTTIEQSIVVLTGFLVFATYFARIEQYSLAILSLSGGLILIVVDAFVIALSKKMIFYIFVAFAGLSILALQAFNLSLIIIAISIISLFAFYAFFEMNYIVVYVSTMLITLSAFFLANLSVIFAPIITFFCAISLLRPLKIPEGIQPFKVHYIFDLIAIFGIFLFVFELSFPYDSHHFNVYLSAIIV